MHQLPVILSGESAGVSVSNVVDDVFTIASKALEMITGNSILLLFFAAPIVVIAIGVIRKLKK